MLQLKEYNKGTLFVIQCYKFNSVKVIVYRLKYLIIIRNISLVLRSLI